MSPKEKLESLNKYVNELKARVASPTPEKHKNHPESYVKYLNLEITKASKTVEKLKLSTSGEK